MDLARNLIGRINVGDSLTRTAASRPDRLAVVDGDRRFTYAQDLHRQDPEECGAIGIRQALRGGLTPRVSAHVAC